VLLAEEDRGELVGGSPGPGRILGIGLPVMPGAIPPGCELQRRRGRGIQLRIRRGKQDRICRVAPVRQVKPNAITAGQTGGRDRGRRDDLIGKELPSQQVGTVTDPEEDPFQDFATLIGGPTLKAVE